MKTNSGNNTGFALLMTIIVVGVIMSVGLTILDLSIKQVRLSSNAKDSEIAFHAANAGLECARYVRRVNAADMETGDTISPACFGAAVSNNAVTDITSSADVSGDGDAYVYTYDFTWGSGSDLRCTKAVTMVISATIGNDGVTVTNMTNHIPGFPPADNFVECEPGAQCTIVSVKGYNRPCGNVGNAGTIEREVLLQF